MKKTVNEIFGFCEFSNSELYEINGGSCIGQYTEGYGADKCYGGGTPKNTTSSLSQYAYSPSSGGGPSGGSGK